MKQYLLIVCLFCLQTAFAQPIEKLLEQHQSNYQLEKIYISHNQPYYSPGDTIYGKLFLVNGRTHQSFDGTPIVYLDWLTEEGGTKKSFILKIEDGVANIAIPILQEYEEGRYLLRAYTQYQKNFDGDYIFQKQIKIIGEKPLEKKNRIGDITDFSVKFYPEGGHLVNGLATTVAFEVKNGKGENTDAQGVILDENKQEAGQLKTLNEGIGVFNFTPQQGKTYKAKINCNGLERFFDLPIALKEGYVLTANSRKKELISLKLMSSVGKSLKDCMIIGHLRGLPFLSKTFTDGQQERLAIHKAEIPSGILHFTLFDKQQRPVCERLVFNNNPTEEIAINIEVPKTKFTKKELVQAKILGQAGIPFPAAKMSVTVYNKEIFSSATSGINIKSYLLLQSDLKGRINNINQYFEKNTSKSRTLLDYLLLTQGWRRFNWLDVLGGKPMPIIYPTEENISFAGKIKKDNNKENLVKADVFLSILDDKQFASLNLTTEEDGLFYFKGFDLPDKTEVIIQSNVHNPKKKAKLKKGEAKRVGNKFVNIELLNLHELTFDANSTLKNIPYNKQEQINFATEINRIRKVDTIYHPEWTINLDAITVRAQKLDEKRKRDIDLKKKYKERGLLFLASTEKIYTEDLTAGGAIYNNIFDLISARVAGASITTTAEGKRVLLRGQSSIQNPTYAAIEVNGIVVTDLGAEQITPSDIELIDVKRGLSATAIYGERGNGGVISILTKDPQKNTRIIYTPGILNIQHPGYHKARSFYSPDYNDSSIDNEKPDYRTTLYWNPNIAIEDESATIEFYTGDKFSEFLILVEGITDNGIPFVCSKTIQVGQ